MIGCLLQFVRWAAFLRVGLVSVCLLLVPLLHSYVVLFPRVCWPSARLPVFCLCERVFWSLVLFVGCLRVFALLDLIVRVVLVACLLCWCLVVCLSVLLSV